MPTGKFHAELGNSACMDVWFDAHPAVAKNATKVLLVFHGRRESSSASEDADSTTRNIAP